MQNRLRSVEIYVEHSDTILLYSHKLPYKWCVSCESCTPIRHRYAQCDRQILWQVHISTVIYFKTVSIQSDDTYPNFSCYFDFCFVLSYIWFRCNVTRCTPNKSKCVLLRSISRSTWCHWNTILHFTIFIEQRTKQQPKQLTTPKKKKLIQWWCDGFVSIAFNNNHNFW